VDAAASAVEAVAATATGVDAAAVRAVSLAGADAAVDANPLA
jgi:hypothetical protein